MAWYSGIVDFGSSVASGLGSVAEAAATGLGTLATLATIKADLETKVALQQQTNAATVAAAAAPAPIVQAAVNYGLIGLVAAGVAVALWWSKGRA